MSDVWQPLSASLIYGIFTNTLSVSELKIYTRVTKKALWKWVYRKTYLQKVQKNCIMILENFDNVHSSSVMVFFKQKLIRKLCIQAYEKKHIWGKLTRIKAEIINQL